ncbi:MAG: tetratricopeptide repeat protein [Verrucomicrobia bacterium]|nr:sel1 repeat family protein [Verrucomicrobiota bacterium]MDA1047878.1 tetratricopeptide repeat protein [Verrucomicrobiota bacterium]
MNIKRLTISLPLILMAGANSLIASPLTEELATVHGKAQSGDAYYQGALALFHRHGERGLNINLAEAEKWARLAAANDSAFGLCTLAGIELEKGNSERGRYLYDEAYLNSGLLALARSNDPLALFCLSMIEIDNPPRNFPKAIRHLSKSADLGLGAAQSTLGMLYFTGIGVKKNSQMAIRWCSKGARLHSPLGMFYLGMAYSVGDGIDYNEDVAGRWLRAAADRNLPMAQLTLGMKYATGEGLARNLEAAVGWLERASTNGSSEAKLQLRKYRVLLENAQKGESSTALDMDQRSLAQIAAEKASASSTNPDEISSVAPPIESSPLSPKELADPVTYARKALTVEKNPTKAIRLLKGPARSGDSEASRLLGTVYYRAKEFEQARTWFQSSAKGGDVEAQRFLGMIFFLGQGVEQDYVQASHWLGKASAGGDTQAPRYLRIVEQFYKSDTTATETP